jgi:ABC-2 type transport system permease protein
VRNVAAVFRRELVGFFGQPLAYVALAIFLAMVAAFTLWFDDLLLSGVASMSIPFRWITVCFLFLVPATTMRSIAEERRTGSLEMIATLPMTPGELVVGKWLAAVVLVASALALTFGYPVALASLGTLDWGPVLGGYLGLLLVGASFASVGLAASSVTDAQVMAFLLAFVACLVPWLTTWFLPLVPGAWVPLVQYATIDYHYANLADGVLDSRSLVFFGALVLVMLRFAVTVLEHRRLS